MLNVAAKYTFGVAGNAAAIRGDGWSVDEPGFTWSTGTQSRLTIPMPEHAGGLTLELSLSPLITPTTRAQRLMIDVNGHRVADERIAGETTLGVRLPPAACQGDALAVTLHHPNAQVPAELGISQDPRRLGSAVADLILLREPDAPAFRAKTLPPLPIAAAGGMAQAVRFLTALSLEDLAAQFESLGRNCELGLVQRAMGAEPLGMLRFSSITPKQIVTGLDAGFENIAARHNLHAFTIDDLPTSEWMVRDATYSTEWHSWTGSDKIEASDLLDKFAKHLARLHEKFHEVLETGHKIFVFQHPRAATLAQVRPMLTLLRAHGPNTLLFVSADKQAPAGTVTQIEPDLFHGHVNRFAPTHDVPDFEYEPWVSVLANTYRLWRESGGGAK